MVLQSLVSVISDLGARASETVWKHLGDEQRIGFARLAKAVVCCLMGFQV